MRPNWLVNQLPGGMLDDDFLVRFLSIFQRMADTLMAHPEMLEHLLDPAVTPEPMLRYLGRWLGIESLDDATPIEAQRRMVAEMGALVGWRGTRYGLLRSLELLTGWPAEVSDNGGVFAAGEAPTTARHVSISVESSGWSTSEHLLQLITEELPASVTFDLTIGGDQLWPRTERSIAAASA